MPHWINATWTKDSLCKAGISRGFDFTLRAQPVNESVGAALSEVDETRAARRPRCDRIGYGERPSRGPSSVSTHGRLPPGEHAQRGNAPLWISRDMSRSVRVLSTSRVFPSDGRNGSGNRGETNDTRSRTSSMRAPGLTDDQVVRVVSAASTYVSAKSCGPPRRRRESCCG